MTDTPKTPYAISEAELESMRAAREREYAIGELLDAELDLGTPETGRDVFIAACADLRSRGIHPDDASEAQLAEALIRVSP